jgi:hypothetical protein
MQTGRNANDADGLLDANPKIRVWHGTDTLNSFAETEW